MFAMFLVVHRPLSENISEMKVKIYLPDTLITYVIDCFCKKIFGGCVGIFHIGTSTLALTK